ncbi:MAG TPA: hypothetical protein PLF32_08920 [Bacteroidales bacterium]|jgi:hypothetical protein|nr:hypothetical protein [Bacteroidales bacterium]HOF17003.1 hypothetical protein [Bacteroidales bacterium]HOR82760.1 hypothetical protein [Bacteroidales bacterium]HPJ91976.1 hypothetical protein [Bacteroidales bacterium]
MSSNFIFLKKDLSLEKDKKYPCKKVIVSLINYSKSIEIVKTKESGTLFFINN